MRPEQVIAAALVVARPLAQPFLDALALHAEIERPTVEPPPYKPRRARMQRREIERVSPEEQARRWDAMEVNLERLDLQRLAARWPIGEPEAIGPRTYAEYIEQPAIAALRARAAEALRVIERHRAAHPRGRSPEDQASRYLVGCPNGQHGQGRSKALVGVALSMVHGFALPAAVAEELLLREYAPRCSPRWQRYDVRRAVRWADRAAGPRGDRLS